MTPSQKKLKVLLQVWMLAFTATTVIFIFFAGNFLTLINQISLNWFGSLPLLPLPVHNFWLVLTISLMTTLVYLCYLAEDDLAGRLILLKPILVSKFVSTIGFFAYFVFHVKALAYLVGIVSDGFVFMLTFIFYSKVMAELKNSRLTAVD